MKATLNSTEVAPTGFGGLSILQMRDKCFHGLRDVCAEKGMLSMKCFGLMLLAATYITATGGAVGATNEVAGALQRGLFEEEANHNFQAALQAYQSAVESYDQSRKLAATALFRLAEIYRKLGQTNEATAQYQRLVRDF